MKISLDKKYRTRDGRNVRVLCTDGPCNTYPVVGYIMGRSSATDYEEWTSSGRFDVTKNGEGLSDLVEIREPREWTAMVAKDGNTAFEAGQIIGDGIRLNRELRPDDKFELILVREILDDQPATASEP